MTQLHAVQDTSTNWTAQEWREIEALKKVLADSDNRSGRPWVIGTKVNKLCPLKFTGAARTATGRWAGQETTRDSARLHDLALEVGETPDYLMNKANVETAWAPEDRVPQVSYTVFEVLTADPNRKAILAKLLKAKEPFDITANDARRARGLTPNVPATPRERLFAFYTVLGRFPKRLRGSEDILLARQIINRLEILIGEAEEEAI